MVILYICVGTRMGRQLMIRCQKIEQLRVMTGFYPEQLHEWLLCSVRERKPEEED